MTKLAFIYITMYIRNETENETRRNETGVCIYRVTFPVA